MILGIEGHQRVLLLCAVMLSSGVWVSMDAHGHESGWNGDPMVTMATECGQCRYTG